MAFKLRGFIRRGLAINGFSVARYDCAATKRVQLRLMRNGRATARRTFETKIAYLDFFNRIMGVSEDHEGMSDLISELKK